MHEHSLNARNYFNTRLVDVIDFARSVIGVSYSKVRYELIEAQLFTFYMNANVKQCEHHCAMLAHDMFSTFVLNKYLKYYHLTFQATWHSTAQHTMSNVRFG